MRYQQEEYRGFFIVYDTVNGWADVVHPHPDDHIERRVIAEDDTIENCAHAYVDFVLDQDSIDEQMQAAQENYEDEQRWLNDGEELEHSASAIDPFYGAGGTESDDD